MCGVENQDRHDRGPEALSAPAVCLGSRRDEEHVARDSEHERVREQRFPSANREHDAVAAEGIETDEEHAGSRCHDIRYVVEAEILEEFCPHAEQLAAEPLDRSE